MLAKRLLMVFTLCYTRCGCVHMEVCVGRRGSDNPKWKGGRTQRLSMYITPGNKSRLRELTRFRGDKTMSDTIEYLIVSEHKMMKQGDYNPLPMPTPAPLDDEGEM